MSSGERRRFGLDLDAIDEYLAGLATVRTDAALREHFGTYRAEHTADMPADPFAPGYRARVLAMYEHLSGRTYDPSNEVTQFDVAAAAERPFPHATGSAVVTGDHLLLVGQLVRALDDLPAGASVLDCGAGWGNSTIELAKIGYRVTALEVEPRFQQLIRERAGREGVDVEVAGGDFLTVLDELAAAGRTFDAVVFFESFHHCDDPARLLALVDRVMAPKGRTLFASEPVFADFPVPWGVRLDGESLWAIRHNGWLELGFRTDFFHEMARRQGWLTRPWNLVPSLQTGTVHVARRRHEVPTTWTATTGLVSQVGTRRGNAFATTGTAGFLTFGPYASLPDGSWRFTVHVDRPDSSPADAPAGWAAVDVVVGSGRVLARRRVDVGADDLTVEAHLADDAHDVEVRVEVGADTQLCVVRIDAEPLVGRVVNRVELDPVSRRVRMARALLRLPVLGRAARAARRMR
jgi:SAM-dependent methyltransferase